MARNQPRDAQGHFKSNREQRQHQDNLSRMTNQRGRTNEPQAQE